MRGLNWLFALLVPTFVLGQTMDFARAQNAPAPNRSNESTETKRPQSAEPVGADGEDKEKLEFYRTRIRDHRIVFVDQPTEEFQFAE